MNQSDHTDVPLIAGKPTGRPRSLWRLPTIATGATAGLTVVSIVLDAGNERARDLALLIGAPTFYLLLPATVACLVVALVRQIRRRRAARLAAHGRGDRHRRADPSTRRTT